MVPTPELTPAFCLQVVVSSTPLPHRYQPADDTTVKTLFDLGVVDDLKSTSFVQGVKKRILPWQIEDAKILSSRSTTLRDAANSVMVGAFSGQADAE